MKNFIKSISAIFQGLGVVGKHLIKPAVTEEYPEQQPMLNDRFRCVHELLNCRACGFCQKVCPTDAIIIKKEEGNFRYYIDLGKCIFCGNCEYYCPVKAIKMKNSLEKPLSTKSGLIVELTNYRR